MRYPVFVCDDDQMQVNDIVKMIGKAEEIISDEHSVAFDVASVTTFSEAKTYLKKKILPFRRPMTRFMKPQRS